MNAIDIRGVQKSFGDLHVLRGVDLAVERGHVFALLGSNGAGKTTLVKILSTLLTADAGVAEVSGIDVAAAPQHVREAISLTGQFAAVDEMLTGRENLVLVTVVELLLGFRTGAGPLAWLAVGGILALFTLALTWVAVIAGVSAKSVDGASAFSYPLIFLPFISSAFAPTENMPGPVRWFADNQPVTSIIESIRALFAGQPVGAAIWVALAWCVGVLVVAWILALVAFRRRV